MKNLVVLPIVLLVCIIVFLAYYNLTLKQKIEIVHNADEKLNTLSATLQEIMNITGKDLEVNEKLNSINDFIIERFGIKYSTIVVFDGAEYVVKASNVDSTHHDALIDLHNQEIFKESVEKGIPKIVSIENENEQLPYQKFEFGRAKSAMFQPIYIDNIYIGYWIIESNKMHEFDNIDVTMIEVIKDSIISVLKTVSYQTTMEEIVREDLYSGLLSAEYLYAKGKRVLDDYTTSIVSMFRINNIEEINEEGSRNLGNRIITEVTNCIKIKLPPNSIFVRYMGPKFIITFSDLDLAEVENFLRKVKDEAEQLQLSEEINEEDVIEVMPTLNFAITTYYKGTGIEKTAKKLEEYLDEADKEESDINFI